MSTFAFATCNRRSALEFIQRGYPDAEITEADVSDLLDFIEADILRVLDPMMHGEKIEIIPGTHWHEEHRDTVMALCDGLRDLCKPTNGGAR